MSFRKGGLRPFQVLPRGDLRIEQSAFAGVGLLSGQELGPRGRALGDEGCGVPTLQDDQRIAGPDGITQPLADTDHRPVRNGGEDGLP